MRDYAKEPLRIFIAAGHGGPDPGAVHGSLREADCNLTIAMLMQQELSRHGVLVKLSRQRDEEDRLKDEIAECNAYGPDFAIALHTNSSTDGKGTGFEVYHQLENWANSKQSIRMAKLFDQNVKKYFNVRTRGLKQNSRLGWLNQVQSPCILVESFFINGPKALWYSDPVQLALFSKVYTRAILEYYAIPYRSNDIFTLRMQMVNEDLQTAKACSCSAVLLNGSHFVNLRQAAALFGWAVHYDEQTKKTLLYPPQYFAPSDFQSGLLKLSDFPSPTERILAGISVQDGYSFDEYGYDETGQLEQYHRL